MRKGGKRLPFSSENLQYIAIQLDGSHDATFILALIEPIIEGGVCILHTKNSMECGICGSTCMVDNQSLNIYYCRRCKMFFMKPQKSNKSMDDVNYEKFERGFRHLREKNFIKILHEMEKLLGSNSRGLEVGCGPGWFLKLANECYDCRGIEPNSDFLLEEEIERKIYRGWYPDDLPKEIQELDFIIYNDVFEHLEDCRNQLCIAHRLLRDGGYLIINCPWNTGVLFGASRILAKLGLLGFYKRLWQVETYTPHLYYFSAEGLKRVGRDSGFSFVKSGGLQTITSKGLKERVDCLGNTKWSTLKVTLLKVMIPLFSLLPKDTGIVILKKEAK